MQKPLFTSLCLLLLASTTHAQETRPIKRYAIVIGVNNPAKSVDPGLLPLSYATHDALKVSEILRNAGVKVVVLADTDEATDAKFGLSSGDIQPPSKAYVDAVITRVITAARKDLAADHEVHLYFYFSGHGRFDPQRNRGDLIFSDGTFSRADLYAKIIRAFQASPYDASYYPHIILDSCFARAVATSKSPLLKAAVEPAKDERIDLYPNAGLLIGVNRDGRVPELTELGASAFSHALISALLGMAEADGYPESVSYNEVAAFIRAANAEPPPKSKAGAGNPAHVDVYVRPPRGKGTIPLLPYPSAGAGVTKLLFGGKFSGRVWVSDDRHTRWLDSNIDRSETPAAFLSGGRRYFLTLPDPNLTLGNEELIGASKPPPEQTSPPQTPSLQGQHWFEFDPKLGWVIRHEPLEKVKSSDGVDALFRVPYGGQTFELLRTAKNPNDPAELDLVQAPDGWKPGSLLSKWWFWTAAGVVVTGGVVAGVLLTKHEHENLSCPTGVECRMP